MEDRLIPLNAWIALLTGVGEWPTPLRDGGLSILRLESKISTSLTNVVVDGLAIGTAIPLIVPTEAKSGANIEEQQARKYHAMTAADVARLHTLPFDRRAATVMPMYACLEQHTDRIRQGLRSIALDCPILVVTDGRVRLDVVSGSPLAAFDVQVPAGPPPRMIPVDAQSPADEYKDLLLAGIVSAAARGIELVAVDSLLNEQVPYWGTYGQAPRAEVRQKATRVLEQMASGEFRGDFRVEGGSRNLEGRMVRVLRTPATFDPRGETQGWQRWQRRGQRELRRRPRPAPPGQMSFEDLGLQVEE